MSAELEDIHEECGIFGVWGHPDAARLTYFGLHALQHRGQEGAGIVSNDHGHLIGHRGLGLLTHGGFEWHRQHPTIPLPLP